MNAFEEGLLKFLQAAAPTIGTLFIHNSKSVAIFNASDAFFSAAVDQATANAQTQAAATPSTKATTSQ